MSGAAQELERLVTRLGVGLPRGVLGDEAWALAEALRGGVEDATSAAGRVSAAHWPALHEAIGAALARAAARPGEEDLLARALALSRDPDAGNPLALAVALHAGRALAATLERVAARLEGVEGASAATVLRAAGAIAIDLLDLDPEEFAPEIEDFVRAGGEEEALRALVRATGDEEIREWAREALVELDERRPGLGAGLLRDLVADGPPPPDPADDPLWVAIAGALADEAVERALAEDASSTGGAQG